MRGSPERVMLFGEPLDYLIYRKPVTGRQFTNMQECPSKTQKGIDSHGELVLIAESMPRIALAGYVLVSTNRSSRGLIRDNREQ